MNGHMQAEVITARELGFSYGSRKAVNGLSFTVQPGEVVGLLGPNGAGKTTTVRLLNGLLPPSAGSARVLGYDPATEGENLRKQTGVLTETPALYERLTARQNLQFFGEMAELPQPELKARIEEVLKLFDLQGRGDDRVSTYSKGMKQRLALGRALLHNPGVLFLDEPTSGLDPEASLQV
ncbi:MAG TPA: ABC transporter ATP-binding protein, partial [Anaerolineaceae bacterium]|nr:ABC transporter ATP-binding protein [Anaerolineaceae bacterium]